jgi:hypothetical protein
MLHQVEGLDEDGVCRINYLVGFPKHLEANGGLSAGGIHIC